MIPHSSFLISHSSFSFLRKEKKPPPQKSLETNDSPRYHSNCVKTPLIRTQKSPAPITLRLRAELTKKLTRPTREP